MLEAAIAGAARRLARLQAVAAATVARVRKSSKDRPQNEPVSDFSAAAKAASAPDRAEALAGFLRVLEQESALVKQEACTLAERSQGQMERERARETRLREQIEGVIPPGLLSSRTSKQRFEDQVRELRAQGQAAVDAQTAAHRALQRAKDTEASPQAVAIERLKGRDPGLVERMAPLLKDAQLVSAAKRHLEQQRVAEIAASRARLERQWAEKKDRGLQKDPGRGR